MDVLPNELILYILSYVPPVAVPGLRLVCHSWRDMIPADFYWRNLQSGWQRIGRSLHGGLFVHKRDAPMPDIYRRARMQIDTRELVGYEWSLYSRGDIESIAHLWCKDDPCFFMRGFVVDEAGSYSLWLHGGCLWSGESTMVGGEHVCLIGAIPCNAGNIVYSTVVQSHHGVDVMYILAPREYDVEGDASYGALECGNIVFASRGAMCLLFSLD